MPKGYWIVNNLVHDAETYARYREANAAPLARHGGRFLVRGGTQETREGTTFPRTVIVEFPSYTAAVACYEDPDYQKAVAIRAPAAEGSFVIVEGYEEA